jgi:protein phosphatase
VLLVLLLVLVVAGFIGYRWSQDQYFVAEHDGKVAIFRGVQADIPGLTLSKVEEETNVTIAALPDYPTEQVASGIAASSLTDARSIVERLTGLARVCPDSGSGAGPGPSPSAGPSRSPSSRPTASARKAAPSRSPSAGPSGSATPRSTATPGPSATPSPTPSPSPSAGPTLAPPDCIEAAS